MVKPEKLTPDQVAALLTGATSPATTPRTRTTTTTPYHPRYSCCDRCEVIQPALVSFHGDNDWSPEIPLDSPVRAIVRALRRSLDRRTILVCGRCLGEIRTTTTAVTQSPQTLPGDWG